MIVFLAMGPQTIVARADPHRKVAIGDDIQVAVNQEKIHLFDDETGRSLAAGDAGPEQRAAAEAGAEGATL
jgi:hypothetical protein